jgi:hypothetical protein
LAAKFLLLLCFGFVISTAQSQVFDVPHREESPTRTLLFPSTNARALVMLFPGGGGMLRLKDDGSTKNRHTFVRSVDQWNQYQINAVLVDTPYDLGDLKRGDRRDGVDHLTRVGEVVEFYKRKFNLPIWIFGHSMGTSTATYFVNQIKTDSLAGIIIAGTVRTAFVSDNVKLPILAIHHLNDQCAGTPLTASESIISSRPKNTIFRLELIEGGVSDGNVCDSFGYHGFNQTEPELVKRAAQFILSN